MTGTIARVGDPQAAMVPARGAGDLRTALRQGSAVDHERLDALMAGFDVHDATGYGRFLTAHAIGMAAVQPAAADFVFRGLGLELPDAGAMLATDLAEVGLTVPDGAVPPLGADQGAGAAYVLLGSRMGMAVITRGLTLPAGVTGRYVFDRRLTVLWKPMRDWLHARPAEGPVAEAALAGTRAAFAAFTAGALAVRQGRKA